VVLLAVPFISAGTLDWPAAWVFAAIGLIITAGSRLMLLRLNPELAAERAAYSEKTDAKPWDRLLMPLVAIYGPLATLVLAGLNRRFAWRPEVPTELAAAGAALLVLASAFSSYALLLNRFFSSVVRIQRDRGHTVVTAGPYRWIRHPGYAGGVVGHLALPLLLGSAWALIPGALTAGLTVLRTALEDRTARGTARLCRIRPTDAISVAAWCVVRTKPAPKTGAWLCCPSLHRHSVSLISFQMRPGQHNQAPNPDIPIGQP